MKTSIRLFLAVLAVTVFATGQELANYRVVQRVPLTQQVDGMNGELRLLLDSRLTQVVSKQMWSVGPWDFAFDENSAEYRSFSGIAPLNAKLQIADRHGKPLWNKVLEYPLAKLKSQTIYSQHFFFLTVDDSAGFGSYSGLRTIMFKLVNRKLEEMQAVDSITHTTRPIYLGRTLKTVWKMSSHGSGFDFLVFSCRPIAQKELAQTRRSTIGPVPTTEDDFVLHYVRYRFDGQKWTKFERAENGFWESDQPFPPESSFPK